MQQNYDQVEKISSDNTLCCQQLGRCCRSAVSSNMWFNSGFKNSFFRDSRDEKRTFSVNSPSSALKVLEKSSCQSRNLSNRRYADSWRSFSKRYRQQSSLKQLARYRSQWIYWKSRQVKWISNSSREENFEFARKIITLTSILYSYIRNEG